MEEMNALMIPAGRRRQARRERWMRIVCAWEQSKLTGVAFAAEQGVDRRSLYRWKHRLRSERSSESSGGIFEVTPMGGSVWAAEVLTARGPVRFSQSAPPGWAGALVRELGSC